jgi:hypothetical protein
MNDRDHESYPDRDWTPFTWFLAVVWLGWMGGIVFNLFGSLEDVLWAVGIVAAVSFIFAVVKGKNR